MKKILTIVGTRPNFIKITQFKKVITKLALPIDLQIVHTGQHFDSKMADVFFQQFGLAPDHYLNVTGSPNTQMAQTMLGLEEFCKGYQPDLMVVVGDVNSTLAGALTSNKQGIPLAHVESGLRSYDRTMPEELNRILTDEITNYFFVTEKSGLENLKKEGKKEERVFFVGNTMIDTMVAFEKEMESSNVLGSLKVKPDNYCLMTMHRPATVDNKEGLEELIEMIESIAADKKIVFPIHPRTIKMLRQFHLYERVSGTKNLILTDPMGYFDFQKLIKYAAFVVTDSGGIQEETTFRRVPCLTLRPNTERPVTVQEGTNTLVPFSVDEVSGCISAILDGSYKKGSVPELWDGKASERIMRCLANQL